METSLKTGFAQIFSCCPKNLSCPKFGGAAAPLAPSARTPMLVVCTSSRSTVGHPATFRGLRPNGTTFTNRKFHFCYHRNFRVFLKRPRTSGSCAQCDRKASWAYPKSFIRRHPVWDIEISIYHSSGKMASRRARSEYAGSHRGDEYSLNTL